MSQWERIDDVLTEEGIKNLKSGEQGDILMFDYEGSPLHLKVMRKTKDGKVYAKRTYAYLPEEADKEVEIVSKNSKK